MVNKRIKKALLVVGGFTELVKDVGVTVPILVISGLFELDLEGSFGVLVLSRRWVSRWMLV